MLHIHCTLYTVHCTSIPHLRLVMVHPLISMEGRKVSGWGRSQAVAARSTASATGMLNDPVCAPTIDKMSQATGAYVRHGV